MYHTIAEDINLIKHNNDANIYNLHVWLVLTCQIKSKSLICFDSFRCYMTFFAHHCMIATKTWHVYSCCSINGKFKASYPKSLLTAPLYAKNFRIENEYPKIIVVQQKDWKKIVQKGFMYLINILLTWFELNILSKKQKFSIWFDLMKIKREWLNFHCLGWNWTKIRYFALCY